MRAWSSWSAFGFIAAFAPLLAAQNLRIEILRGAASNNNTAAATIVTPAVRVKDAAGKPVAGALVVFTAPFAGPSVDFGGDGPLAHAQTDESGSAVAPRPRAVGGNGPVEIEIVAEKGADSAHESLIQMNIGLDSPAVVEDLNVTLFGIASSQHKADHNRVNLRVALGENKPAAKATVECILRAVKPSGETDELLRITALSDDTGLAVCEFNRRGGANTDLVVRATLDGRSATRYFKPNLR